MVEVRRKTALQRNAAQAVGLTRGSAGFSFELSAWFCVGAWVRVGRRVDGAVVGFGIVLRLAALLTHPLTLPRRTADGRGATQDRSTTPRGASRCPESRFGGFQFRTFSVVLRGRVGSRGRRVVGTWSGSGLSFGLLLY